jgi:NADP-reducing hydrogenase subunit HndC
LKRLQTSCTAEDITKLEILAKNIKASALCGLGQTAQPVLSTLDIQG